MAETDLRPNIRIEISNNLVESELMEVEEEENEASGREEGEIWEDSANVSEPAIRITPQPGNRVSANKARITY